MTQYKYTKSWFINSEINQNIGNFIKNDTKNIILEIGCYEGLSSVFFADHLLEHPDSLLTCVDPFLKIDTNDHAQFLQNNEEHNFDYNISHCNHTEKITVHKITSDNFFTSNKKTYTFIYIDGSHECDFITRDMENSFAVLEKNGIMWMDDYGGGDGIQIKQTMNAFLDKYKGQYIIINSGYQLAIKKL
jgi:predicted O-methyltransferase YrrM